MLLHDLIVHRFKGRGAATFVSILLVRIVCCAHGSTLLTFDDLNGFPDPSTIVPNGYGGLFWDGFYLRNGGGANIAQGYIGLDSCLTSSICCSTRFDLESAYLWSSPIRVQGRVGSTILYDNIYCPTNGLTLIAFNYFGVNNVTFTDTNAGCRVFSMDSVTINIHCDAPDCQNYVVGWGCNSRCNSAYFLTNIVAIAANGLFYPNGLYLREDGLVVDPWQPLPDGLTNVIAISRGDYHSLALKADGKIVAWGSNTSGQISVPNDLTDVIAIAAGAQHSLALKADGSVVGFGGSGGAVVPDGLSNIVSIAAGNDNSLALRADGKVFSWGAGNTSGVAVLSNIVAIAGGAQSDFSTSWEALQADGRAIGSPGVGVPTRSNILAISLTRDTTGDETMNMDLLINGRINAAGFNICTYKTPLVPPGPTNFQDLASGNVGGLALVGNGPPPLGPPILNALKDDTGFHVTVPTRSGRVYRLEYTDALGNTNWTGFPLIAGNGAQRTLNDPAPAGDQRFYRVRHWWHN